MAARQTGYQWPARQPLVSRTGELACQERQRVARASYRVSQLCAFESLRKKQFISLGGQALSRVRPATSSGEKATPDSHSSSKAKELEEELVSEYFHRSSPLYLAELSLVGSSYFAYKAAFADKSPARGENYQRRKEALNETSYKLGFSRYRACW